MTDRQALSSEAPEVLVLAQAVKHMASDYEGVMTMPSSYLHIISSMLLAYAERYEDYVIPQQSDITKITEMLSAGGMTMQ